MLVNMICMTYAPELHYGYGQDYFELGAVLIRKKLFTQAVKNLEKSIALWNGNESDLAQVSNLL